MLQLHPAGLFRVRSGFLVISMTLLTWSHTAQSGTPGGLSARPGDRKIELSWSYVDAPVTWNVKRSLSDSGPYSLISSLRTNAFSDTSVSNGIPYYYVVSEVSELGESSDSPQVVGVPSGGMPTPFQTQDFVSNGLAGGAGYVEGTYTLSGSGALRSVFQTVSGGGVSARLVSMQSADASAEAGLVLSAGTTAGAIGASVSFAAPDTVYFRWYGPEFGGLSWKTTSLKGVTLPVFLRLRRTGGGTIYAGVSSDGNWWVEFSNGGKVPFGTNYYVRGISTRTYSASSLTTATFDHLDPSTLAVVPAPSGLVALPGNGQVMLTWLPALGATNYNIKRTTVSGASYSIIGSSDQRTFTDRTVNNGTAYYYVVSALGGGGESADCQEISAIPMIPPTVASSLSEGRDRITISWPDLGQNMALFHAVGLDTLSQWMLVMPVANSINGMFSVDFPTTNNLQEYFRLQGP